MTNAIHLFAQIADSAFSKDNLKDILSFGSQIAWPIIVLILIWLFHKPAKSILSAIGERIDQGATIIFTPSHIEISSGQAPPGKSEPASESANKKKGGGLTKNGLPHSIYMTHQAYRDKTLDRGGLQYYRLRIALDADEASFLGDVQKVVYHLHPTFHDPERKSEDSRNGFEIQTSAWGEFNMFCEVYLRNNETPLLLERYINFLPTRP